MTCLECNYMEYAVSKPFKYTPEKSFNVVTGSKFDTMIVFVCESTYNSKTLKCYDILHRFWTSVGYKKKSVNHF